MNISKRSRLDPETKAVAGEGAGMAGGGLRDVSRLHGAVRAQNGITPDRAEGRFAAFVCPAVCDNSALPRAIAGVEAISGGSAAIGALGAVGRARSGRDVAMRRDASCRRMTLREKMDFGMKVTRCAPDDRARRIAGAARVGQVAPCPDSRPGRLSGGQRQGAASGRAIVREPLSSRLGARLRGQMRVGCKALHRELATATICVIHDRVRVMALAKRIMMPGFPIIWGRVSAGWHSPGADGWTQAPEGKA